HEHGDHIRTLPKIAGDDLQLIATSGTARHAGLPAERTEIVNTRAPVRVASATVHMLPVRHDASDPCGYHIEIGGVRLTVLTDLGSWQDHLVDAVASSNLVLLEANYNETMLARGPYPARLKRRVASEIGHLGNIACGQAMVSAVRTGRVEATWWLSHLSQTNNSPQQAELDVRETLNRADLDAGVTALPRRDPGPVWAFEPTNRKLLMPTTIVTSSKCAAAQLGLPGLG
ncbi:MAG TPA: MBL fold metallo-hydrolase, partial [Thermomicrobiales bacterium]|nr:MBL fold metallo-hydrolase [Thermomicrobiales bacterium]